MLSISCAALGQAPSGEGAVLQYGWGVCGYAGERLNAYEWHLDRREAESAKLRLEGIYVGDGRLFDRVEVRPDKRSKRRDDRLGGQRDADPNSGPSGGGGDDGGDESGSAEPAPVRLEGTCWIGAESGHPLQFVFEPDRRLRGLDRYGAWRGSWKMVSPTRVTILFTHPNQLIYVGEVSGGRMTGVARNPLSGGTWRWELERDAFASPTPAKMPYCPRPGGVSG